MLKGPLKRLWMAVPSFYYECNTKDAQNMSFIHSLETEKEEWKRRVKEERDVKEERRREERKKERKKKERKKEKKRKKKERKKERKKKGHVETVATHRASGDCGKIIFSSESLSVLLAWQKQHFAIQMPCFLNLCSFQLPRFSQPLSQFL